MRLGFLSLGDLTADPRGGGVPSARQRLAEIVEAAVAAEELGFDSFGVGEHHSARWVTTAPPVVLGAMAARTERIRLRTGVSLLANLDPVRVAEDYATVDLLSGGRLELTAARGNFPQPWSLFGQDIELQRERLAEAIDLLAAIWSHDPIDWEGSFRPPLVNASIGPRPLQNPPRIWCGVASSPASVEFAAERGLPIMVASTFRSRDHVGSLIDHYRGHAARHGHDSASLEVGVVTQTYIREDGDRARLEFETHHRHAVAQVREGSREPLPAIDYDGLFDGPVVCGTPQEAVDKLRWLHERYRHDTHQLIADFGGIPWTETRRTMELFAEQVVPALDAALGAPVRSQVRAAA